jgi:hypothetical protein
MLKQPTLADEHKQKDSKHIEMSLIWVSPTWMKFHLHGEFEFCSTFSFTRLDHHVWVYRNGFCVSLCTKLSDTFCLRSRDKGTLLK